MKCECKNWKTREHFYFEILYDYISKEYEQINLKNFRSHNMI